LPKPTLGHRERSLLISELSNRERRWLNRTLGHLNRTLFNRESGQPDRPLLNRTLGQRERALLNCTLSHPDRSLLMSACTFRNDRYTVAALNTRDKNTPNRGRSDARWPNSRTPWRAGQGERKSRILVVDLLRRWSYFMKSRGGLFVPGEDYIDLRVRRDGNDDAAVRIEIHHFGIARRTDIFSQPLP
jgi:hypothetical protein